MIGRLIRRIVPPDTNIMHMVRHISAGLVNTLLTFLLFWLLYDVAELNYVTSSFVSWLAGITLNYLFMRFWVFHDLPKHPALQVMGRHLVFHVAYYATNLALLVSLVEGAELQPVIAQVFLLLVLIPINFVVTRLFVIGTAE